GKHSERRIGRQRDRDGSDLVQFAWPESAPFVDGHRQLDRATFDSGRLRAERLEALAGPSFPFKQMIQ
ncbi:MAG: hypothetical protein WBM25_08115, partial [Azonexus sp.]